MSLVSHSPMYSAALGANLKLGYAAVARESSTSSVVVERSSVAPSASPSPSPSPTSSSSSSAPPPSSSVYSAPSSSANNNYVPPSSTYTPPASSTYSYVAPSSSYSYVAPTTSYTPPPSSTPSARSSDIPTPSSVLLESIAPTPTTEEALLQPSDTATVPSATATNAPAGFFKSLGSSPLNIVGTAAVSTLILVIIIFLVSFVLRKCLLKKRIREAAAMNKEFEEDDTLNEKGEYGRHSIGSGPPGWTPYGYGERPQSHRSDHSNTTPSGLRPFYLPSPNSTSSLPDRPSTRTLLPSRLAPTPLAAPKPAYPSSLRPFALPSPPPAPLLPLSMQQQPATDATPLSTRENLDAWKVWATGAVESAGAAIGGFVKTRTVGDLQTEVELEKIQEKNVVSTEEKRNSMMGGGGRGPRPLSETYSIGSVASSERQQRYSTRSESIFLPTPAALTPAQSPTKKRSSTLLAPHRSPLKPTKMERGYSTESEESVASHLLPYHLQSPTKSASKRASYQSHYSQASIASSTPSRAGSIIKKKISLKIRRQLSRKDSTKGEKVLSGRERLQRARDLVNGEREGVNCQWR